MNGARQATGLVLVGSLAFALRAWAVLASSAVGDGPQATLAMQWLQCGVGALLVPAVAWLAWSLAPDRPSVGWVAALATAAYPPHVDLVTQPHAALWAALALTLLLAAVASARWRATRRKAVLVGCLAGLLFATEPLLTFALPVAAVAFWLADGSGTWRGRFSRASLGRMALLLGVASAIITACAVGGGCPNFRVNENGTVPFDARTVTSDTKFAVPAVRKGTVPFSLRENRDSPQRENRDSPQIGGLCLDRLHCFLLSDPFHPAPDRLSRIATVAWLVLAMIGLWISRGRWRALWPSYVIFLLALLQALVVVAPWLRATLEPMTFVWGSAAVAPLLVRLLPGRQIRVYRPGEQARDPFDSAHVLRGPHYDVSSRRRAG